MLSVHTLIALIAICVTTSFASYNISSYTTIITNPLNKDYEIPLDIYYPSDSSDKFPILVFGHCLFGYPANYYAYIWQSLVPNGYIVAIPESANFSGNEKMFARDIRFSLDFIRDNCTECPFKDNIGDRSMVSGHSLGAGSTIYCIADTYLGQDFKYEFDSAMTLSACGAEISAAQNITKPTFLMDGSDDCMCPPSQWSDKYYSNIPNGISCKYEGIITNATHCNFADLTFAQDKSCLELEENDCTNATQKNPLNEKLQLQYTIKYMNLFMNATLYNYKDNNPYNVLNEELNKDKQDGIIFSSVSDDCT